MEVPARNGDFYPLDEIAIAYFAGGVKELERIHQQMQGALMLLIRQYKLDGVWRVAENGRELERISASAPLVQ